MTALSDKLTLFDTLMQLSSEEIYVLDADTLVLQHASEAVCKQWNKPLADLRKLSWQKLIGLNKSQLAALVAQIKDSPQSFPFNDLTITKLSVIGQHQVLLIRKPSQYPSTTESNTDTRFQALVRNTPGLVFEFKLDRHGEIAFGFVSEACKALLGVEPEVLRASAKNFYKRLNIEDRKALRIALRLSANEQKLLNWEGRIWIEEWRDTKWINIRATPRLLANGATLWEGIMTNITQSKLEKIELEESRQRLAELSAHLERAKEDERARISREIHDDLGGNLTAIKIALSSIMKRLPADQPLLLEKIISLEGIVDNTFEAAHRISGDLRPTVLSLGISAALEWQAKEFERRMEMPCQFNTNLLESDETEEQATALFRICQEALSNIAKYALASRVDIALFFGRNEIKMLITDDGVGIDKAAQLKPDSFGLRGMQERAAALNGSFSIEKIGNRGTNITVILPRITAAEGA